MQLRDAQLFREKAYIDGHWVDAENGQTVEVTNPATGDVIGTVPKLGATETRRAIESADRALPAWLRIRVRRQVHVEHVHADAADRAGAYAIHQNRRARRADPLVTIGVAAGHDADSHGSIREEGRAVADGIARFKLLHCEQAAGQRHGWLQAPECGVVLGMVGRASVHQDTAAYPVASQGQMPAMAKNGRTVGQATLSGNALRDTLEGGDLVRDALCAVANAIRIEKCIISVMSPTCGRSRSFDHAAR